MKYISKMNKIGFLSAIAAMLILSSCNKDLEQFSEAAPVTPTGNSLGATLAANPDDSLYLVLVKRGGLLETINNTATTFTMFVPGNNAMRSFVAAVSGGLLPPGTPDPIIAGFLSTTFPADQAAGIVSYNIVPQSLKIANIPAAFPNFQYATILNPQPTLSDLLRLTTFPSASAAVGPWVNNVPLVATDIAASNGIIHNTLAMVVPPQRFLWDRINTDAGLTYLKAAIIRADSGIVPGPPGGVPTTLQGALESIGANLTVFAPTDAAFQATLTGAITQALIQQGLPPATAAATAAALASSPSVFSNPALYPVLTAQTVQGIVSYHLLTSRAFTNNFPTTETAFPTLLSTVFTAAPTNIKLKATFSVPFVSAATVQGNYNATPANILINASPLLPDPYGTSDQHFVNGTIQEIDQVLIPLPL
ncbi:MAG: fasciclin domain-containing protein [Ferruginibacter sp.]